MVLARLFYVAILVSVSYKFSCARFVASKSKKSFDEIGKSNLPQDLMNACRNVTALGDDGHCEGIYSPVFDSFLKYVNNFKMEGHHDVGSTESWDRRCKQQQNLNDSRYHVLCAAAAFAFVPFSLKRKSTIAKPNRTKFHDISQYELVAITVESRMKNVNEINLLRSACIRDISVTVLVANATTFRYGDKITILKKHLNLLRSNLTVAKARKTIIIFVDSKDVVFQSSAHNILSSFLDTQTKILFSAEHSCYPFKYFPYSINLGRWLGPCKGSCSNNRYICDSLFDDPPAGVTDRSNKCKERQALNIMGAEL